MVFVKNLFPDSIDDWTIDVINKLVKLRDVESEGFDFKDRNVNKEDKLSMHLCAMANTHGGFIVLGIREIKNNGFLTGFEKRGFQKGQEDKIKNDITNHQVQIEPIPDIETKTIDDGEKFFVAIHVNNKKINKPYFLKERGFYVRVGASSRLASRNTVLSLFSDTDRHVQDLKTFKASINIVRRALAHSLNKFEILSSSHTNRIPQIDLTLLRSNVVKCESFLLENDMMGENPDNYNRGITKILYTLDTLNTYIDGFSRSTSSLIKSDLQKQVRTSTFTLYHDVQEVPRFFDLLVGKIDQHLKRLTCGSG